MHYLNRNRIGFYQLFLVLTCLVSADAQSTSQDYPTPVTATEINGTIKPRDVGDARLTSYFYQFDGSQGDLFINIVTRNFTGDIDVFIQNGLRPLTKIVVYAESTEQETGRVLYLRKPEKMILRVQGRTPGDEPATFRIKFAGSFVASTQSEPGAEPTLPSLTAKNESGIRVNSVGTIVEIIPKATPTPAPAETAAVTAEKAEVPQADKEKREPVVSEKRDEAPTAEKQTDSPEKKVEVVVTDNIAEKPEATTTPATPARTSRGRRRTPPVSTTPTTETPEKAAGVGASRATRRGRPASSEPKPPDPLEKVNLVIQFKDGQVIQRPMSEVSRFSVDKGVLTVLGKDGSVRRFSILDVAKVTIE